MNEYLSDHLIEKRIGFNLKEYLFDLLIEKSDNPNYMYSVGKNLYGYHVVVVFGNIRN